MSSLTILNDTQVKEILHGLNREEVETLQQTLRDALHEYSTNANNGTEECKFSAAGAPTVRQEEWDHDSLHAVNKLLGDRDERSEYHPQNH